MAISKPEHHTDTDSQKIDYVLPDRIIYPEPENEPCLIYVTRSIIVSMVFTSVLYGLDWILIA